MKSIFTYTWFVLAFLLMSGQAYAVGSIQPTPEAKEAVKTETAVENKKLNRQENRQMRKQFRTQIKNAVRAAKAGDTDLLLLVIISILIPPLGMYLYDGLSNRFWISLLLTLLFFLPGLIYTLVVILGEN